jgi:hypothetical protein
MRQIQLPNLTNLTDTQQKAIDETDPIAIFGGAGSGKSIISIFRHIKNWEEKNINSYLITYTHTLTYYFENSINNRSNKKASTHISTKNLFTCPLNWIGEVIIDEAQDVPKEKLEKLASSCNMISYSADDKQSLYTDVDTDENFLKTLFPQNRQFYLFI